MQNQFVRMGIAVATVAVWAAIGLVFHLDPNAYLVAGIPLVVIFQLVVARRPLTELWLRDPSPRRFPWWTVLVTLLFMALPIFVLIRGWAEDDWGKRLWSVGAVVGAVPLAWAIANVRVLTLRCLGLCFVTAGIWGMVLFFGVSVLNHQGCKIEHSAGIVFGSSLMLYLPVCFMMEEVFFRGALDSFVFRPGDKYRWWSAVLVTTLWGWWHLPIVEIKTWAELAADLVLFPAIHMILGLSFSMYWRKSGNLLVPAAIHSFVDAVRNAVM